MKTICDLFADYHWNRSIDSEIGETLESYCQDFLEVLEDIWTAIVCLLSDRNMAWNEDYIKKQIVSFNIPEDQLCFFTLITDRSLAMQSSKKIRNDIDLLKQEITLLKNASKAHVLSPYAMNFIQASNKYHLIPLNAHQTKALDSLSFTLDDTFYELQEKCANQRTLWSVERIYSITDNDTFSYVAAICEKLFAIAQSMVDEYNSMSDEWMDLSVIAVMNSTIESVSELVGDFYMFVYNNSNDLKLLNSVRTMTMWLVEMEEKLAELDDDADDAAAFVLPPTSITNPVFKRSSSTYFSSSLMTEQDGNDNNANNVIVSPQNKL